MKVKICGIMEPTHAKWVVEAGADFLGLIFAPSKRLISPERAREIVDSLSAEGLRDKVSTVGVFVNERPAVVNEIAEACGLDYVQLSGDEPVEYCRLIRRQVIKAVKLSSPFSVKGVAYRLEDLWAELEGKGLAILIEPRVQGAYGGTGKQLDWAAVGQLSGIVPVLLAGGLNPDNVEVACRLVRPWGVDTSSGVETNGIKDESKIKAFVAAARRGA